MSVLHPLVPSPSAFPSTSLVGLLSSPVRRSALLVAKMLSAGPCLVARIRVVVGLCYHRVVGVQLLCLTVNN